MIEFLFGIACAVAALWIRWGIDLWRKHRDSGNAMVGMDPAGFIPGFGDPMAEEGAEAMNDTAVIMIGNTDDKLTQREWSEFVSDVTHLLLVYRVQLHFHGCSVGSAPWQNVCWVFDAPKDLIGEPAIVVELRPELARLAAKYRQDSIALTVGKTEFVEP